MTRNGICQEVNKEDNSRVHAMTTKTDGQGRIYTSCDRCGTTFVGTRYSNESDD